MANSITDYSTYLSEALARSIRPRNRKFTRLTKSRLLVDISIGNQTRSYRILTFAVGHSGRNRADERRVEITSTYETALKPIPKVTDVVLGIDRETGLLVGIDARRLDFGGETSNASTFVYQDGFLPLAHQTHRILAVPSKIIPGERQLYLRTEFLAEYLQTSEQIHRTGIPAGSQVTTPSKIDSTERASTKLTYEQQLTLAIKKMEIGQAGERHAFRREIKRITTSFGAKCAKHVEWVSQTYPYWPAAGSTDTELRCFDGTGGVRCRDGSSAASSSLRR